MALLTHFGVVSSIRAQGVAGGLRGVVYDAEFDGPVPEATVKIVELNRQTNTVESGHFLFGDVPAGSYTLTVSKPGYERYVQSSIVVAPGELADATVRLKGEFTEMEELVVRDMDLADTSSEIGLLNLRGTSLSFQDSISKEMMSRAGASDAAGALRLVVGASVADGKYATVRGLSDRYVGTALNGIRIPSADPKKRSVHMDMFPAGTIESMSVSKTFTPDLPGDYTGGGVNIRTIGIPDKPFLKLSFSREFNRDFTDKPGFVTYDGAGCGRWGRDLGARDMPAGAEDMEENGLTTRGVQSSHDVPADADNPHDEDHQEYDRITKTMAPAVGTKEINMPDGNHGYTLSGGKLWDFGGATRAGGTAAFTYSKKYSIQRAEENILTVPRTNLPYSGPVAWTNNTGTEEVKWSMLGSVGIAHEDNHEVTLTFLRNRAATDRASLRIENHDPETTPLWEQRQAIQYTERSLDVMQLAGTHRWDNWLGDFAGLELDWFGVRNVAEQKEPDVRSFRNYVVLEGPGAYRLQQPGSDPTFDPTERTLRLWRDTKEDNSQYGLNLGFPFKRTVPDSIWSFVNVGPQQEPWAQADGKLKLGFTKDFTHRWYEQKSYYYSFGSQYSPADPTDTDALNAYYEDLSRADYTNSNPNALWTDVFTDPNRLGTGPYQNSMRWYILPNEGDVSYEGDQNFRSGYWMIDLPMTARFRLTCGARLENTEITIDPTSDKTNDPSRAFTVPVTNALPDGSYYYTLGPVSEEEATTSIHEADWLRSVGFVYDLTPEMKVRGTWSQTIARPTFLELAPVTTYDFITGDNFVGNQDLQISHIVNTDLRWEWFPRPGEVFAFSLFRKKIEDPIEKESFSYLGQDYLLAVNYPDGTVDGWEIEGRKQLDFLPDLFQFLSVGANYTFIDARVDVPEQLEANLNQYGVGETTLGQDERDMEGQPEFLWNINVTYDVESLGTAIGFFYSVRGDMLRSGAAIGDKGATPNIYSKELATVNFSLSQEFAKRWRVTVQAKNLLNPLVEDVYRAPDGTEVLRRSYREGVTYSFQLGAAW